MSKKEHHEEHVDETWLIPYADMLTLLLALFIVMFAMSKVDQQKLEALSKDFSAIFKAGGGFLEKSGDSMIEQHITGINDGSGKESNKAINKTPEPSATVRDSSIDSKAKSDYIKEDQMMKNLKNKLDGEISKSGYDDKVKVELDNEGLEISIQDIVLFNSGNSSVLDNVKPLLLNISNMLKPLENEMRIEGHTDNLPIKTEKYNSNWDLSAMRAINVMEFMISEGKLSSEKFSIQAFGEYQPKYDNNTEEGRSKNRRVEIYIVRKYFDATKQ